MIIAFLLLIFSHFDLFLGKDDGTIGILTVKNYKEFDDDLGGGYYNLSYDCWIPAGYVRLVESAGLRAVAIPCTGDMSVFWNVVKSVNGFLFGGMFTDYQKPDNSLTEFGQRGKEIIRYVISENKNFINQKKSDRLPLFAICKGYNMMAFHISELNSWHDLIDFPIDALDLVRPLIPNPKNNSIYGQSKFNTIANRIGVSQIFLTQATTMNRHPYGISPKVFMNNQKLVEIFGEYKTHTLDAKNVEFVSLIEGKNIPLFGFAFHPEKTLFEWDKSLSYFPKKLNSTLANGVLSILIGEEARKNNYQFIDSMTESQYLFSSTTLINTFGLNGVKEFSSSYFFNVTKK